MNVCSVRAWQAGKKESFLGLSGGIEVCRVVMAVDVRCGVAWCCVVWRGMFGVG